MAADGRLRRTVGLTPAQALHERLLREVLNRLRGLDLVLKGGSALAFVHGLGRHRTDLDFDGRVPVDIRDRMRRGASAAGVVLGPVKGRKRRKGHRFRAPYPNPFERRPTYLKVDLRLDPPPRARDVVTVGGIRTYKVEAIFEHKLRAMRSRIEGRDLFDVAFVMEHYGARLTDDHVRHAATLTGLKQARLLYR